MNPNHRALADLKHYNSPDKKYIALQDLNFAWIPSEIDTIKRLCKRGAAIWDMSETVSRPQEEVFLLLLDLTLNNKVKVRKEAIFGVECQNCRRLVQEANEAWDKVKKLSKRLMGG